MRTSFKCLVIIREEGTSVFHFSQFSCAYTGGRNVSFFDCHMDLLIQVILLVLVS